MNDCIFCKIIIGELPCHKIYEDEKTLAFLDISRDIYGHILVVPKIHAVNVLDASAEILASTILAAQKISRHLVEHCGFDGVNILNASGKSAQQSVFHLHFHIIPRKTGDGADLWPLKDKHNFDLAEIATQLRVK